MTDFESKMHVRVYYEDTDFSGRVYHASFLRFLERGRTEWLRELGLRHDVLAQRRLAFAVRRLSCEFVAPAHIDDPLTVVTKASKTIGAVLPFRQAVLIGERTLLNAEVEVVTISGNRPVRPPRELMARLRGSGVDRPIDPVTEGGEP